MITPRNVLLAYGLICVPVCLSVFLFPQYTLGKLKATSSITGKADELSLLLTRWWGAAALAIPTSVLIAVFTGTQKTHRKFLKYLVIPYQLLDMVMTFQHYQWAKSHKLTQSGMGVFYQNWAAGAVFIGLSLLALYNIHTPQGLAKAKAEAAAEGEARVSAGARSSHVAKAQ